MRIVTVVNHNPGSGSVSKLWLRPRAKTLSTGAQTPVMSVPGEPFTNPVIFHMLDAVG